MSSLRSLRCESMVNPQPSGQILIPGWRPEFEDVIGDRKTLIRRFTFVLVFAVISPAVVSQNCPPAGIDAAIASCIDTYLTGNCDPAQLASCIRQALNGCPYNKTLDVGGAQWSVVVATNGGDASASGNFDGGVIALGGNGSSGSRGGDATATNSGSGTPGTHGGGGKVERTINGGIKVTLGTPIANS